MVNAPKAKGNLSSNAALPDGLKLLPYCLLLLACGSAIAPLNGCAKAFLGLK
jgi:hypothetical protein